MSAGVSPAQEWYAGEQTPAACLTADLQRMQQVAHLQAADHLLEAAEAAGKAADLKAAIFTAVKAMAGLDPSLTDLSKVCPCHYMCL